MDEPSIQPSAPAPAPAPAIQGSSAGGASVPVSYPAGGLSNEREQSLRTLTHVLYGLYASHWLTGGITGLVAIIINYVKRADVVGTRYQAHFEWQIRTF